MTWELESQMRESCPTLFPSNDFLRVEILLVGKGCNTMFF